MTKMLEISDAALTHAERTIGEGPVVMVNLLWLREKPDYPAGFADAKPDSLAGYYEGYVGGFREACAELGVEPELVYAGPRVVGILAGPGDDWDQIAVVRYKQFSDLKRILESETYARRAKPHRFAVVADWRFIATRDR